MQFTKTRLTAKAQKILRSRHVREPGIVIRPLAMEGKAGGGVQDGAAMPGHPVTLCSRKPEPRGAHIALQAGRHRNNLPGSVLPGHEPCQPNRRGFRRAGTNKGRDRNPPAEQVAQQVSAEEASRARQKDVVLHSLAGGLGCGNGAGQGVRFTDSDCEDFFRPRIGAYSRPSARGGIPSQ